MSPLRKVSPPAKVEMRISQQPLMEMIQAGRSNVSLAIDINAGPSNSPSSTTDIVRPDSRRLSNTPPMERRVSNLSMNHKSYLPVVPSPLNPSASSTTVNSSDETKSGLVGGTISPAGSSSSGDLPLPTSTDSSGNTPNNGNTNKRGKGLSSPQQLLRRKSELAGIGLQIGDSSRSGTPKGLKDLGHDYSRYPNSRTPSSYGSELSAPRPLFISEASTSSDSLSSSIFRNPFRDSSAALIDNPEKWNYPDDRVAAFHPYFGGEKGFILYDDEIEDDDNLHIPNENDDRDFKPTFHEWMEKKSLINAIGGIFMVIGLLCVFILLPVLTFTTRVWGAGGGGGGNYVDYGPAWAHVNNRTYPLLRNVRTTLIDPDTPQASRTRKSTFNGETLNLVFSDEFNNNNRTFYPGDDPFWTAPNIWYGATQDMEWYDPVAVTTGGGTLQLRMDAFANHNLGYQSGMLNSWNQLCFKGGILEVSISLPGPSAVPGLWPGVWSMGNLGRPGYKATTEGVWPYTYNSCDYGITPNQSSPDGLSELPGQKLNSCTCKGQDHPTPGTGRGAPEIDVLEGSVDPNNRIGVVTQSFQVAPFDVFYRPNHAFLQIPNYNTTNMNSYCGGPFQQAISGTTLLNNDWYDGLQYQKYAFEYTPGVSSTGKIAWFVGDDQTFMMDGRAIGQNGNVAQRLVSEEPMSVILNLGISGSWSQILLGDLRFPTTMHVDYVRIYQREGMESVTCDPEGWETTEYIEKHPVAYRNANLTAWNQTGYEWPTNSLINDC
ncbi:uncharacterized protein EAE97_008005 [Botrytis byssoidea]|uniref:GH16 domain-containing protein n=1 Tax=Botrytis byssoidea TaxID=139641 RepID=A0A9P5M3K4_9HELO|nr:uncharacterized protein EAE97_008005 [Botrytis byssoidea]KAF7936639.1 hypothetical protein EAE97_008005 [Botrytis byssoidea]